MPKKTYLRPPNDDYAPDTNIQLGHIWLNPKDPGSFIGPPLPIPGDISVNRTYKESWTIDFGRNAHSKIGYWAKIAQLPVAAGGYTMWGRSQGGVYTVPRMDTYSIEPTPDYAKASIALAPPKNIRKGSNFYMVTGVKIARGGSGSTVESKDIGADITLGVDATIGGIPAEVGGEIGHSTAGYSRQSFSSASDYVFAYRVREIFYHKTELKIKAFNKGAVLGEGLSPSVGNGESEVGFIIEEAEAGNKDFVVAGEIDSFIDDDGEEVDIVL
ncbi:hypothetical protein TWF481_011582 [Arthrobotrys musiformis]|uniref:Uncharacterized protein n=1 Tax=Arthrobotrys musiformis TaxID=47236 RepID=A0AAV9VYW0_9PEZI